MQFGRSLGYCCTQRRNILGCAQGPVVLGASFVSVLEYYVLGWVKAVCTGRLAASKWAGKYFVVWA